MKKLLLLAVAVTGAVSLTACSEEKVKMSFVGTYEMVIPSMGTISGGHLINFNNDGTLDIYCGFYSVMAGTATEVYTGTYTIDGDDVEIDYSKDDVDYNTTFTLSDESFATKILVSASLPSSDITYYQIDTLSFDESSKVSIGTKSVDGKPLAYALELKEDDTFNFSGLINTTKVSLTGEYKVVAGGLEADDTIEFTYNTNSTDRTQSFTYNNTNCFSFNLIHSANTLDTNVTLVRFQ